MNARLRPLLAASALAFLGAVAAPVLRAQEGAAADLPKKEITEKTSNGFPKLRPLLDAKNYYAALTLVGELLAEAPPGSYDIFVLSQIRAQILLTQNKLAAAIEPLETAHRLALGNANFRDGSDYADRLQMLAQLHFQLAAEEKDPARQRAGYERALDHARARVGQLPRPSADTRVLAASILYNLATLDSPRPDATRLREALEHAREASLLSLEPGAQIRLLQVACHLQLGENARAAELLELMAARDPKNASAWSQLQSLYLAAAAEAKDPAEARAKNLRALLTLERAQALGHLSSPKDHYTKVAILFNVQQFTRAAALLEKGLADGTLEDSRRNWELLASAYQQTAQDAKALDAMSRAVGRFPADGALEFSLAQFLYGAGRVDDAYARGQSALAKPGVEKPGSARLYLAFLAYELQRYDEAARWAASARETGEVPAATLDPLQRAISDALAAREALKKS